MRPPLLFLLALITPVALCAMLVVPIYASILGAVYVIYLPESGAHPLDERLLDMFYIGDAYYKLAEYWLAHTDTVSFVDYSLPVVGLPLLGIIIALWGTYKLASALLNVFRLSASI